MKSLLPDLVSSRGIDFTIANGENAAGGIGLTEATADELLDLGIDVLTSGNHIWDRSDCTDLLTKRDRVLRPANYPSTAPGRGAAVYETDGGASVGVLNLQGRTFMQQIDCPFRVGSRLVRDLRETTAIVVVDAHAEATSEKLALGWYLAGGATAVLGTHTHVQTADERILEGYTAYITDVGMTGPIDSVIGIRTDLSIARFITQLPQRFEVAKGRSVLSAVIVDVDEGCGAARGIERVMIHDEGQAVSS